MAVTEKGRFCSQCNKTVIDYTKFTDNDLFEFIKLHKTIPCGQFYTHQLDSPIQPPLKKKHEKNWFIKIAASFIALLSFNSGHAAGPNNSPGVTMQPAKKINDCDSLPGKIIISGKVTDEYGNKLEKAEITFNGNKVAETNKDGSYEFEVNNLSNKPYLLQFSYPGLPIAVRTFYTYMRSTTYDIVLAEAHLPRRHGGIPVISFLNFPDTTISFKFNDKSLTPESKNLISELANEMRMNPGINVTIIGEVRSGKEVTTCRNLTIALRQRLIDHEGISPDRLIIIEEPITTKRQNVIRIESPKQQN